MACELPIADKIILESDAKRIELPVPESEFGSIAVLERSDNFAYNLRKPTFTYNYKYESMCNGLPELRDFFITEGYKRIKLTDQHEIVYEGFFSSPLKIYTEFEETFKSYEFSFIGVRNG